MTQPIQPRSSQNVPPPLPAQPPPPLQYQSPGTINASEPLAGLIPYKNWPALTGYYLGLFSLFPILGLPLGITAIVFGVMGLNRVNANPMVRGKGHALTALICGSLFSLFNLALIGMALLAAVHRRIHS
jgi:hypothetical protein